MDQPGYHVAPRSYGVDRSQTTPQDVADAAGLSRATQYRYFADRNVLLTALRDHEQGAGVAQPHTRREGRADRDGFGGYSQPVAVAHWFTRLACRGIFAGR